MAFKRKERDLTLRELAKEIGMTPQHIASIERGLRTKSRRAEEKIEDALGIPRGKLHEPVKLAS